MTKKKLKRLATDTKYRAATFIETYTGRAFDSLRPDPSLISIIDIAHALSHQCRYSGHVESFFSTAQHCCLLADYTAAILNGTVLDCLQILMHDAAETYLVDIPRPVKQFMPEYRAWDHDVQMAVREWLDLSDTPMPSFQDEIDTRVIVDERAQLMSDSGNDWGMGGVEPLGIVIEPWTSKWAEHQFLMRYATWTYALFGKHQYLNERWDAVRANYHETISDIESVADLVEVDFRGKVGRIKLRTSDGMMVRDPAGGRWPRAAWRWVHGDFTLTTGTKHGV